MKKRAIIRKIILEVIASIVMIVTGGLIFFGIGPLLNIDTIERFMQLMVLSIIAGVFFGIIARGFLNNIINK